MKFNTTKSYTVVFSTRAQRHNSEYSIGGEGIQSSDCVRYLGVHLQANLHWDRHVGYIINRANRTLGLIRHTLHNAPSEIKKLAYYTLCRPILEFGCEVWDPHTASLIHDLEVVQNKAIRFIYNIKGRDTSITSVRSANSISTLQRRRHDTRIQTFINILEHECLHPTLLNVINALLPNTSTRKTH